jgi:hypothetical protein
LWGRDMRQPDFDRFDAVFAIIAGDAMCGRFDD